MESEISESDWNLFHQLRPLALNRFSLRWVHAILRVLTDPGLDSSRGDRTLALRLLGQRQDQEMADMFSAPQCSTALAQLARMQSQGLLTEEEFARFSSEARASVEAFLDTWRAEPLYGL